MSQWVQRADGVKESPRGVYMSGSIASAMQTQPPPPRAQELQAGEQYHVEPVNFECKKEETRVHTHTHPEHKHEHRLTHRQRCGLKAKEWRQILSIGRNDRSQKSSLRNLYWLTTRLQFSTAKRENIFLSFTEVCLGELCSNKCHLNQIHPKFPDRT